jgi:hypothetical protein
VGATEKLVDSYNITEMMNDYDKFVKSEKKEMNEHRKMLKITKNSMGIFG